MSKGTKIGAIAIMTLFSCAAFAQSEFDQEIERMMEISKAYGTCWGWGDDKFDDFLKAVRERDEKLKYCSSIVAKYKADIDAKNERGNLVKQKIGWVKSQFGLFFSQAESFGQNFKKRTDHNFMLFDKRMEEGEKSNLWAICQTAVNALDDNATICKVLQAFNGEDDPSAKAVLDRMAPLRATAEKKIATIKKATERVVKMPTEAYSGADKERHRAAIKKAWAANYGSDKILKIVFPKSWTRKDEWNHNGNGNYSHSDMSYLVAMVIVQKDTKTAMIYPAYVNKNNLSGAISYGVKTKGGDYVNDEIAIAKVK